MYSVKELEQELSALRADHEALKKQHQQQLTTSGSSVAAAAAVAATKARQFSGKLCYISYLIQLPVVIIFELYF